MSFLGSTGAGGASGKGIVPGTQGTPTLLRSARNVADGAKFTITEGAPGTMAPKSVSVSSDLKIYKTADNTLFETVVNPMSGLFGTNLVNGTSYYVKTTGVDGNGNRSLESAASNSLTALCLPGTPGTPTATGSTNAFSTTWTASASGGETTTYTIKLYQSSNSGSSYTNIYTDTTTNTSYSYSGLPGGSTYYYYVTVTPSNASGNGTMVTSSTANVIAAPPPPPYFAPPPSFGPWFPPSFGPYFCLQADSPVLVWVDGKTLKKKVKDIQVGDKVVSYTFAELPENDSEYSLNSWNSQSMTPLEVKEATVVRNEKLVTQSTVFFNGDQDNRMSLEHLVFIKRDGSHSIVLAGLVEIGDIILKINEETLEIYESVIESVEHVNEQTEIYKLDVTPYDIFFGGNILTHNKGGFY